MSETALLKNENNDMQAFEEKNVANAVLSKIHKFQSSGQIFFPANYSPENALKSAYLILNETVDKNKQPVLKACTMESVANCLLNMVIQGLSPAKKQCYFIAYGNKLTLMTSYFGYQAIAKQFGEIKDIVAEVIYNNDEFEFEIDVINSNKIITKHKRTLESMEDRKIRGAYATIIFNDGTRRTEIMTTDQIKTSWKKSKMSPDDANSTHKQFPEEMSKRTVINKLLKSYINTKNDSNLQLLKQAFKESEQELAETEVEYEISEEANTQEIDFDSEKVIETESVVVQEKETLEVPPARIENKMDISNTKQERNF